MSEMKMYFVAMGDDNHRYPAMNQWTADHKAKQIAELTEVFAWLKPVLYDVQKHGQFFEECNE